MSHRGSDPASGIRGAMLTLMAISIAGGVGAGTLVATGAELTRAGTAVSVALPDGTLVSSVDMWLACSIPPPSETELVAFSPGSRRCVASSPYSAASVVAPGDPVLPFGALDVSTAAECLSRRAVVFVDAFSGLRYCLPWSACPELDPEIVGGGPVCAGDGVTLEVLGVWEEVVWSPGGETTAQIMVSPAATTTYTVTVTDTEHCAGSASFEVDVLPLPAPEISGPTWICLGEETVLDAGPGWTTYFWRPGGETTQTIMIAPSVTTTYAVTVTDDAGCQGSVGSYTVSVVECAPPLFADGFESGGTDAWSTTTGG